MSNKTHSKLGNHLLSDHPLTLNLKVKKKVSSRFLYSKSCTESGVKSQFKAILCPFQDANVIMTV